MAEFCIQRTTSYFYMCYANAIIMRNDISLVDVRTNNSEFCIQRTTLFFLCLCGKTVRGDGQSSSARYEYYTGSRPKRKTKK